MTTWRVHVDIDVLDFEISEHGGLHLHPYQPGLDGAFTDVAWSTYGHRMLIEASA